jgi:hypothetical protein
VSKRIDWKQSAIGCRRCRKRLKRFGRADFYAALNDDQKARFNTMGKQLFAQNH